jgi:nitrogen fixation protein FixH
MKNIIKLNNSLSILENWIIKGNFKGWDPFDALNSPILKSITGDNRKIGQIFVQLFKKSPINFRQILGVPKGYNPKGMGLFLSSYARISEVQPSDQNLQKMERFASWLDNNKTVGKSGVGWGYNFDWPNRSFFAPRGTPTTVNTAFIGLAFLDLCNLFESNAYQNNSEWNEIKCLGLAQSACEYLLNDINQLKVDNDQICFSYTELDNRYIHNANILAAWLLSEIASRTGNKRYQEKALAAARFTTNQQLSNGSWLYGIDAMDKWVDNFHTGFVLTGLLAISKNLETTEFDININRGYSFWKKSFLPVINGPKYYQNKIYPIDVHNIAQTILTGISFSSFDADADNYIEQTFHYGVDRFQSKEGFFYYQKNRFYTIKIPYMRWSQAWMFRALSELKIVSLKR